MEARPDSPLQLDLPPQSTPDATSATVQESSPTPAASPEPLPPRVPVLTERGRSYAQEIVTNNE
ncbi:hypothetical protein H0H93_006971, partial [Arthromyces matolae]